MKPCLAFLRELVIATFVIGGAYGQQCNQTDLDTCITPYLNFFSLANVTEAVLNDGCSNLNNVSLCMKSFGCAEKPISDPNAAWNGIKDASTFVCSKRSDVLKNWPCWKQVFEVTNPGSCYDAYAIDTNKPSQPQCYAVNKLVQCIKSNLTAECGSAAGDLYAVYYYKQLIAGIYDVNRTCAPDNNVTNEKPVSITDTTVTTTTVTTKKPDSSSANLDSQGSLLSLLLLASVAAFLISSVRN